MPTLVWALLMVALGVALVVAELLVPSGGLITIMAVAAVVSAIIMMFVYEGPVAGGLFFAITAISMPFVISAVLKWLPDSFLGRMFINIPPPDEQRQQELGAQRKELLGKHGTAMTNMLPSGAIKVDGRTYDAVSKFGAIDVGTPIEIIAVDSYRIVVRPASPTSGSSPASELAQPSGVDSPGPLDAQIPDPFEET